MKKLWLTLILLWLPVLARAQQKLALTAASTDCSTAGSCLTVGIDPNQGGATFTVSANASANTIQFEATGDGTAYFALNVTPSNSTTAVTSTTSTGTWQANVAGYVKVRMRMSTLVGGTTTVTINQSNASARAGGGGGGGSAFPVTVTGGVSGAIPCFTSTTTESVSVLLTANVLPKGGGAGACPTNSSVTDNGTTVSTTEPISSGASPPTITPGTGGVIGGAEGTTPSAFTTGQDWLWQNSTNHCDDAIFNNIEKGCIAIGTVQAIVAADWTCGTGGTNASCAAAQTISTLSFTLPLAAVTWTVTCDGVVGQATGATANSWNIQTATNGATNLTASYYMATAATAMTGGAVTDVASTTTTQVIAPTWTLGGTGTKMPFHIAATVEGASASGTVVNIQLVAPTVADLVTIYRGTACVGRVQ